MKQYIEWCIWQPKPQALVREQTSFLAEEQSFGFWRWCSLLCIKLVRCCRNTDPCWHTLIHCYLKSSHNVHGWEKSTVDYTSMNSAEQTFAAFSLQSLSAVTFPNLSKSARIVFSWWLMSLKSRSTSSTFPASFIFLNLARKCHHSSLTPFWTYTQKQLQVSTKCLFYISLKLLHIACYMCV